MVLAGLQERWRPFQARLFPQQVLLEITDALILGQGIKGGRPLPLSIEAPIPAATCRKGRPLQVSALGDFIGDLLLENDWIDAHVLAVLPRIACTWRVLEWPDGIWPDDPVSTLRGMNPDLGVRLPLDDSYLDLQPLPGRPDHALMVAAPKAVVDGWIEVFSIAGVALDRLEPQQACLLEALAPRLREAEPEELIVLLQPETHLCTLLLLRNGEPVYERDLEPRMPALLETLQKCLAYYRHHDPAVRSIRLLLTGHLPGIEPLEQALGVQAEQMHGGEFGSLALSGLLPARTPPARTLT
ncbi:hypothetical protein [Synechococcus sp. CCY9202]|uniref:hypothetical protein n=1 Tax=Synechococcus sp. CCY9202 TaxID=174698 RepID=UPI002B1FFC55|nr:hypothetical protein [Synechococcus sp. CCY9202]MEA5424658.1 hypothetical protein [Synechococcus sp. CCY9202]